MAFCRDVVYYAVEFLKIVGLCILAAVLYGIVHDQVTARVCVEYFTVFHPPIFSTRSPTLLGLGWGVIATWWAGAIIGMLIAIAARLGLRNQFTARELVPYVAWLMFFMAVAATVFGAIGYFKGVMPPQLSDLLPVERHRRFLADWWAHSASYASGFLGGIALCIVIAVERLRRRTAFGQ